MTNQKILIKIVSYRDPELVKTIASALAAADHPERVEFAIVNQVGDETRDQLAIFHADPRFTVTEVHWSQSLGLGWARNMCDAMWRGQEFTLQLDSHMRFLRGWDSRFISDLERTDDPRGVISCYPATYHFAAGAEVYSSTMPHKIIAAHVDAEGIPSLRSGSNVAPLARTLIVAGGMQFSRGEVCIDVPNNDIVFYGDETAHSIRLFCAGYNVYAPSKVTIFHLYERHKWMHVEYWSKNLQEDPILRPRFRKLYDANIAIMMDLLDLGNDRHLGSSRTKHEFNAFAEGFRDYEIFGPHDTLAESTAS